MKAEFNIDDDTLILVSLILVSLGPKANGRICDSSYGTSYGMKYF